MDKCSKLTRHTGRVASNANCDASKRVVAVPSAQAEDDARREDEHVLRKHAVCDPLPNNLIAQLLHKDPQSATEGREHDDEAERDPYFGLSARAVTLRHTGS
uniref:Uncharacterized protein n=1 Tax=Chrysotila carterae TaxID=13221 RepID=A0A7S4B8H7_CHRCT